MHRFSYSINPSGQLIHVSESWLNFAAENGASTLSLARVLGRNVLNFFTDGIARTVHRELFREIRENRRRVSYCFRCDSPGLRRFMHMEMSLLPDHGILFNTTLLKTEVRPWVTLLDAAAPRTLRSIPICGWCKRVQSSSQQWLEAERAAAELAVEDPFRHPHLEETICRECSIQICGTIFRQPSCRATAA